MLTTSSTTYGSINGVTPKQGNTKTRKYLVCAIIAIAIIFVGWTTVPRIKNNPLSINSSLQGESSHLKPERKEIGEAPSNELTLTNLVGKKGTLVGGFPVLSNDLIGLQSQNSNSDFKFDCDKESNTLLCGLDLNGNDKIKTLLSDDDISILNQIKNDIVQQTNENPTQENAKSVVKSVSFVILNNNLVNEYKKMQTLELDLSKLNDEFSDISLPLVSYQKFNNIGTFYYYENQDTRQHASLIVGYDNTKYANMIEAFIVTPKREYQLHKINDERINKITNKDDNVHVLVELNRKTIMSKSNQCGAHGEHDHNDHNDHIDFVGDHDNDKPMQKDSSQAHIIDKSKQLKSKSESHSRAMNYVKSEYDGNDVILLFGQTDLANGEISQIALYPNGLVINEPVSWMKHKMNSNPICAKTSNYYGCLISENDGFHFYEYNLKTWNEKNDLTLQFEDEEDSNVKPCLVSTNNNKMYTFKLNTNNKQINGFEINDGKWLKNDKFTTDLDIIGQQSEGRFTTSDLSCEFDSSNNEIVVAINNIGTLSYSLNNEIWKKVTFEQKNDIGSVCLSKDVINDKVFVIFSGNNQLYLSEINNEQYTSSSSLITINDDINSIECTYGNNKIHVFISYSNDDYISYHQINENGIEINNNNKIDIPWKLLSHSFSVYTLPDLVYIESYTSHYTSSVITSVTQYDAECFEMDASLFTAFTNTIYGLSGVMDLDDDLGTTNVISLSLEGVYETDITDYTSAFTQRNEFRDQCISDATCDADLNIIVVASSTDYGGYAFCYYENEAFAAVPYYLSVSGYLNYPHELGHLQGFGHDAATDVYGTCGIYDYAHGYRDDANDIVTVMAYPEWAIGDMEIVLPRLSTPDRLWNGFSIGDEDSAYNAKTLRMTAANLTNNLCTYNSDNILHDEYKGVWTQHGSYNGEYFYKFGYDYQLWYWGSYYWVITSYCDNSDYLAYVYCTNSNTDLTSSDCTNWYDYSDYFTMEFEICETSPAVTECDGNMETIEELTNAVVIQDMYNAYQYYGGWYYNGNYYSSSSGVSAGSLFWVTENSVSYPTASIYQFEDNGEYVLEINSGDEITVEFADDSSDTNSDWFIYYYCDVNEYIFQSVDYFGILQCPDENSSDWWTLNTTWADDIYSEWTGQKWRISGYVTFYALGDDKKYNLLPVYSLHGSTFSGDNSGYINNYFHYIFYDANDPNDDNNEFTYLINDNLWSEYYYATMYLFYNTYYSMWLVSTTYVPDSSTSAYAYCSSTDNNIVNLASECDGNWYVWADTSVWTLDTSLIFDNTIQVSKLCDNWGMEFSYGGVSNGYYWYIWDYNSMYLYYYASIGQWHLAYNYPDGHWCCDISSPDVTDCNGLWYKCNRKSKVSDFTLTNGEC